MIKLGPRPDVPQKLNREAVLKKKEELADKIDRGENLKAEDFPAYYWLDEDVREPLWKIHNGKCSFCERKREIKRESDVEHYRPKTEVSEDPTHPGYWWLAYEWNNYLYSCKPCNETYKKNHFPLLPDSHRAYSPSDDLSLEKPVLINPIDDDPEACISYDWWSGEGIYVIATGIDKEGRGSETIEIVGLNRRGLMEERAENLSLLETLAATMIWAQREGNQPMIKKCADDIRTQTSAEKTFAGFRRAFFKAFGLTDYVATD